MAPIHPPPSPRSLLTNLISRDDTVAVPAVYKVGSSPAPGTVVGIVFGSVAGFLFLLYLVYLAFGLAGRGRSTILEEEVIRTRPSSHSRSPKKRRRSRNTTSSRRRSEMVEERIHTRSRSPVSPSPRPRRERERIIVEERRTTPVPVPMPVDVEEDIVEVIEEHSTPPASRVGGSRIRRERERVRERESGWRSVDPDQYGGGRAPRRSGRR